MRKLLMNLKTSDERYCFPLPPGLSGIFEALDHLELHEVAPQLLLPIFAQFFPQLRKLLIHVDKDLLHPPPIEVTLWEDLSNLSHLQEFSFCGGNSNHMALASFVPLVSKISSYFPTDADSFLALAAVPQFQPIELKFGTIGSRLVGLQEQLAATRQMQTEMWRAIARMGSLKGLEFKRVESETIREVGFPPNLEVLALKRVVPMPTAGTDEDHQLHLAELMSKVPTTLRKVLIAMELTEFPRRGTPQRKRLVDELLFWNELETSFGFHITAPNDNEQRHFVQALESEVFERGKKSTPRGKIAFVRAKWTFGSFDLHARFAGPIVWRFEESGDEEGNAEDAEEIGDGAEGAGAELAQIAGQVEI